jgi:DNA-binding transcriptional ArsR family regulator
MTAAVDQVFTALADPTRRELLEVLGSRSACSATALAREFPVSRQAILKHLRVLYGANLVASTREGREVIYRVHPEQLVATASWMTSLAASWDERLAALKRHAELEDRDAPS